MKTSTQSLFLIASLGLCSSTYSQGAKPITTRFGSLSSNAGGQLLFKGRAVQPKVFYDGSAGYYPLKTFVVGKSDVILFLQGSNGCPTNFVFVTVTENYATSSESFGTCYDEHSDPVQKGQDISISMPNLGGNGKATFVYRAGAVLKNGEPIKAESSNQLEPPATTREWKYAHKDSPFDGEVYTAARSFQSDVYDAEIAIVLKCVADKHNFSLTFISRAFDANGNLSYASNFGNTMDLEGEPVAVNGRVKWANRQPTTFVALLLTSTSMFTFNNTDVMEAAGPSHRTASAALRALLPAYFELANGAGTFTLSIPDGNPGVERVLSACD